MEEYLLEVKSITKSFFGSFALKDVNLQVRKGEVHALIGENGAGKSTLMRIVIGAEHPNSGSMLFKGETYKPEKPMDALAKGISMIHQEISLATNMTVAENIFIGREPTKYGLVDRRKLNLDAGKLLGELEIDPNRKTWDLSVAQQQMVEIARAISYNSDLIIMDEPTSALTEQETEKLFRMIRMLKKKGVAIIIITHKLEELFQISDVVTVMRDGSYVGTWPIEEITQEQLVSQMVGREISNLYPKQKAEIGEEFFRVENYTKKGVFHDVSFRVRKGEILGVAGLMGAGRSEIMQAIFAGESVDSGTLYMEGKEVHIHSPKDAIRLGIAMVTEDRKMTGLSLVRSSGENITIANLDRYSSTPFTNQKKEAKDIQRMIKELSIKLTGPSQMVRSLSGGNQQKIVIARWLLTNPKLLILDEPTRGIDVGAKSEIHRLISQLACKGMAVIMISSELPEILGMSDRVLVIHDGTVTGEVQRSEATQELIMSYATNIARR